jgi:hypothetical protein
VKNEAFIRNPKEACKGHLGLQRTFAYILVGDIFSNIQKNRLINRLSVFRLPAVAA